MAPNVMSVSNEGSQVVEENIIAILALTVLLVIFFVYCCWGTSSCKSFCSRIKLYRNDELEVLESRRSDIDQTAGSPTIILLPQGRILVVDETVFARFQSESNGLDLFELGDRMFMHEQSLRTRASSLFDSEPRITRIKALPRGTSLPPTYESLFGEMSTPPPYTEVFRCDAERTTEDTVGESSV